jgi:hypothetical protein
MIVRYRFAALAVAALLAGCKDSVLPKPEITDGVAPAVVLAQPGVEAGPNSRFVNTPRGKVAGTIKDDQQVTRATLQLNGGAEQPIAIQPGDSVSFLAEVELATDRDNSLVVHAYDAAGNRGSSETLLMTIDTVPPAPASVSTPVDGQTYSFVPGGTLFLYGTTDAYQVGFSLNGVSYGRGFYGRSACNFACFESPLINLLPGDNLLEVYTYDRAGNRAAKTIRFKWYELPAVRVTSPGTDWLAVAPDGQLRVAGSATHGQQVARLTWQANDGAEQEIAGAGGAAATFDFTVPLRQGPNQVKVNAYNSAGLKNSVVVEALRPLPSSTPGAWASLNVGSFGGCGLTVAGRSYCWGWFGLTWGSITDGPTPEAVPGSPSFASIVSGNLVRCGIGGDGTAFCWGMNENGVSLGTGSPASQPAPAPVAGGHRFARISAGDTRFACGTTVEGEAFCWGEGSDGQLGNGAIGSGARAAVPVAVAGGHRWKEVSAGLTHACGLTTTGAAYCWGNNSSTQLGNASSAASGSPVAVAGGHTFVAISAGGGSSCGLDAAGTAFCWGLLRAPGSPLTASPPAPVAGGLTFRSITVGYNHACGVTGAGRAYCWGSNDYGQLGNGSTQRETVAEPVAVAGGLTFTRLTAGYGFTCGVASNNAAYCWGYGLHGKLGNGTRANVASPVRMIDPA